MALIAHTYGWEPSVLRSLTDAEVEYYHEHVPLIAARAAYPIAQLHADLLDFVKPRYLDPDPNPSTAPPRRTKKWEPDELLPWFAWFERKAPMPREAAEALVGHYDRLPVWAREIAPISEARAVLAAPE